LKKKTNSKKFDNTEFSAFDVLGTLIIAYGISKYFDVNLTKSIVGTFAVGELTYLAFGIETPFFKMMKNEKCPCETEDDKLSHDMI
jgi:hypothetical protein